MIKSITGSARAGMTYSRCVEDLHKFECVSFRKENGRITAIYKNRKTSGSFIVEAPKIDHNSVSQSFLTMIIG